MQHRREGDKIEEEQLADQECYTTWLIGRMEKMVRHNNRINKWGEI